MTAASCGVAAGQARAAGGRPRPSRRSAGVTTRVRNCSTVNRSRRSISSWGIGEMRATSVGHLVAGGGVDEAVVRRESQPVALGLLQHRRTPDDPARVVAPEHGEEDALVRSLVGEAAEDPGGHRDDVAVGGHVLALATVCTPPQAVLAAEVDEHLGREVQVQAVGRPARHARRSEAEAVRLGEVHELLRALRNPGADEGVVVLAVRAGGSAVDERRLARHPVAVEDRATSYLVAGHGCLAHAWPRAGRPFVVEGSQ